MDISRHIDATVLKPIFNIDSVKYLLGKYRFRGFCSFEETFYHHPEMAELCREKEIKQIAVKHFPFGTMSIGCCAANITLDEYDVVINPFMNSIESFVAMSGVKQEGIRTKLIIEPILMFMKQFPNLKQEGLDWLKLINDKILEENWNVDFIKTSTGFFSQHNATAETVEMLRGIFDKSIGIKASGGIKSYIDAIDLLSSGADVLGIGIDNAVRVIEEGNGEIIKI